MRKNIIYFLIKSMIINDNAYELNRVCNVCDCSFPGEFRLKIWKSANIYFLFWVGIKLSGRP